MASTLDSTPNTDWRAGINSHYESVKSKTFMKIEPEINSENVLHEENTMVASEKDAIDCYVAWINGTAD